LKKAEAREAQNEIKKESIWDFMPQVNEELLEHNIKKESGIQGMWEDEALDVRFRDMRISECGVITEVKGRSFNSGF
jgi:hypothetical protein